MESLELRIFLEVVRTKSISRAAETMGYVQSNITAHIKNLEKELNTVLLIRHNKGVTLTKEGEKLLHYASQIVSLLDQALKEFQEEKRSLRIGASQTIAGYLLPQCLTEYQKRFPDHALSVITANPEDMEEKLYRGELDCVFSNRDYVFSHAHELLRVKERLVLIAPPSCEKLEQIWGLPVIVNSMESCPYRGILLEWLISQHPEMPPMIELDTVEAIIQTAAREGGISLLPEHVLSREEGINRFCPEGIRSTFITMWIPANKLTSDYADLKTSFEYVVMN